MKLHSSFFATIAAIFAVGFASAQTPAQVPPHEHGTTPSATQSAPGDPNPLTLAGCLMRQKDVAATYLLVAVQIVSHHQNQSGMISPPASHNTSEPHGAPQTAASAPAAAAANKSSLERLADSPSFTLTGIPLERLAKLDGKRVQVAGHIDATTVVDADRGSNSRRPADDLGASTFVATSIDAVDGTCPKR
jgi:hypothetical protein